MLHIGSNDMTSREDVIDINVYVISINWADSQAVWSKGATSSVFRKSNFKSWKLARQVKELLREQCKEHHIDKFSNNSITTKFSWNYGVDLSNNTTTTFFWKDGVHLSDNSKFVFPGKKEHFLNDFIENSSWLLIMGLFFKRSTLNTSDRSVHCVT